VLDLVLEPVHVLQQRIPDVSENSEVATFGINGSRDYKGASI
jgi:hypothetical protein